jgi:hypothetical protein
MDSNQHTPVSDDQELANVLAGMNQQAAASDSGTSDDLTVIDPPKDDTAPLGTPELTFEDTPLSPTASNEGQSNEETAASTEAAPTADELPAVAAPGIDAPAEETPVVQSASAVDPTPAITPSPSTSSVAPTGSSDLDDIKKDALDELRPLVDKLDLPADEKFDTILLIIRSTDDKSLVNAAHEAARAIPDEAKRAQALLDVIKEIDYFSGHGEQPA